MAESYLAIQEILLSVHNHLNITGLVLLFLVSQGNIDKPSI
jgi:hypothetical protein